MALLVRVAQVHYFVDVVQQLTDRLQNLRRFLTWLEDPRRRHDRQIARTPDLLAVLGKRHVVRLNRPGFFGDLNL
ncbi:hypothetical protein WS68_18810 [Burkholderia sp. TSV86]|nr:hypothetical protein WS68_18810 [Burkholderia sp. TSV86]